MVVSMADVVVLSDLKTMLSLDTDENDSILNLIIKNTVKALRFKLGLKDSADFPSELDYIALEVCIKRYNRLKNEGMQSYSQEGESMTFNSNDFDDFLTDIEEYRSRANISKNSLGSVSFCNPYAL